MGQYDELVKTDSVGLSDAKAKMILEKTPAKYILKRKGRGNNILDYVEIGYIISKLNATFNYMWSFEVIESKIENKHIWVLGKLTAHIFIPSTPPIIQSIVKSQYGGSELKTLSGSTTPVDTADDYKAATSDALKKCASMFGIAQDVFWKGERIASAQRPTSAKTAEDIVYADHPNTATQSSNSDEVVSDRKATESQIKWITSARDSGKITLTDEAINKLSFSEAVGIIGEIRKGLGK